MDIKSFFEKIIDDKTKLLMIGGLVIVGGIVWIWFQQHEASVEATNEANAQSSAQTDAELAQQMLESPLSNGQQEYTGASATTAGETGVDTNSAALNALVASILNPASSSGTTTGTGSTSGTTSAPTTPAPSAPTVNVPSTVAPASPVTSRPTISPAILQSDIAKATMNIPAGIIIP